MTLLIYLAGSKGVSTHPSARSTMTNTAVEATASSSGKNVFHSVFNLCGLTLFLIVYGFDITSRFEMDAN